MCRWFVSYDRLFPSLLAAVVVLLSATACLGGESEPATPSTGSVVATDTAAPDDAVAQTSTLRGSGVEASCGEALGVAVGIPDTAVALPVLDGFYVTSNFTGLFNDRTLASVLVLEFDAPWDEVIGDIDRFVEGLEAQQGVVSQEVAEIELGGRRTYLVRAWQRAQGVRFEKWLAVVDGEDSVLLLTAQVPSTESEPLIEPLRNALLCADWTPGIVYEDPDGPLFEINPGSLFVEEMFQAGSRGYIAGESAYFFVTPSLSAVAASDQELAALGAFSSLGPGPIDEEPVLVRGPDSITIDGLPGLVIEGTGFNEGKPILLYQVMLFTPDGLYYRLLGSSPSGRSDELMPQIQAMAESFRLLR